MDLDLFIGRFKIKYKVLNSLLNTDKKKVDFFIDVSMILQDIYRESLQPELVNKRSANDDATVIVVNILNLVAHYRNFFNYNKMENRIYLIFNTKTPRYQKDIVKDFGEEYYEQFKSSNIEYKYINEVIDKVFNHKDGWLKSCCDKLPGIYYVNSNRVLDLFSIGKIIKDRKEYSLVFTQNTSLYQLVSIGDVDILHYHKKDKTEIINKESFYEVLLRDKKYKPKELNYNIYRYFMVLNGYKKMGIEEFQPYFSTVKTLKVLDELCETTAINNNISWKSMRRVLADKFNLDESHLEVLDIREDILTINNLETKLSSQEKSAIDVSINVDIYDTQYFDKLNKHLPLQYQILSDTLYTTIGKGVFK